MIRIRAGALILLVALLLVVATAPGEALEDCIEPNEPSCISSRYSFEEQLAAVRCRRDVDYYLREAGEFVNCLERKKQTIMQRSSQLLSKLNCRTRGELQC